MPAYTTKKFCVFILSSVTIGFIIISLAGYGIQSLLPRLPVGTTYYQSASGNETGMGRPMYIWALTNHTIIVLENDVVESMFITTVRKSPPAHYITIEVSFGNPLYSMRDLLTPQVVEGNLSWSGIWNQDIHINDTIIIKTKVRFDLDGWYLIAGVVKTSNGTISGGYGTFYYLKVEHGNIVIVTDDQEQVPTRPTQGGAIRLNP